MENTIHDNTLGSLGMRTCVTHVYLKTSAPLCMTTHMGLVRFLNFFSYASKFVIFQSGLVVLEFKLSVTTGSVTSMVGKVA